MRSSIINDDEQAKPEDDTPAAPVQISLQRAQESLHVPVQTSSDAMIFLPLFLIT